jgi:hypothetical protein
MQVALSKAGWFYRSFANSFTLCLISQIKGNPTDDAVIKPAALAIKIFHLIGRYRMPIKHRQLCIQ